MKIWLSFVVPVYKTEKYLDQCIGSILSQPFDDIEIILVDDGSPDKCPQICDEYRKKDARIRVIHKENEGVSKARAIGISLAKGDYISCVDSDDWISEDYCVTLKEIIEKDRPSIVKYSYYIAKNKSKIKVDSEINAGFYTRDELIEQIYPVVIESQGGRYIHNALWTCIIDSTLLKKYCLKSRVVMGEDAASLKPCVINASSMRVIESPLYFYRVNETSIIQSKRVLPWNGPQLIKEHYDNVLKTNNIDLQQQILRNTIHNLFNVAVSQFYKKAPYMLISKEIKLHLQSIPYNELLTSYHSRRDTVKHRIAHIALKHNLCGLLWVYSKFSS